MTQIQRSDPESEIGELSALLPKQHRLPHDGEPMQIRFGG
jgi:hypothetical protein